MGSIVLSCETGLVKPDPEIFKLCAARLGVRPEDCLYVGDGGSDELRGASTVGMTPVQAVWFTRGHVAECENQEGFPILNSPQEVIHFLHSGLS
jgi:putative hydrolase of the HAD superfamily